MKIAILTDSAAMISSKVRSQPNIKVLQIPLSLDGETYYPNELPEVAGLETLREATLNTVTEEQIPLTTISAVTDELQQAGYTDILCIHIASSISGLGSNLSTFAKNCQQPLKIHLFDSHTLGPAEGALVKRALTLITHGLKIADILAELTKYRQKQHTLVIMENLKNLRRIGSISNNAHLFSNNMLHYKTLLHFSENGELEVLMKSSRTKKIATAILNKFRSSASKPELAIMADNTMILEKYVSCLKEIMPQLKLVTDLYSPSIFSFIGPQALIISWQNN